MVDLSQLRHQLQEYRIGMRGLHLCTHTPRGECTLRQDSLRRLLRGREPNIVDSAMSVQSEESPFMGATRIEGHPEERLAKSYLYG